MPARFSPLLASCFYAHPLARAAPAARFSPLVAALTSRFCARPLTSCFCACPLTHPPQPLARPNRSPLAAAHPSCLPQPLALAACSPKSPLAAHPRSSAPAARPCTPPARLLCLRTPLTRLSSFPLASAHAPKSLTLALVLVHILCRLPLAPALAHTLRRYFDCTRGLPHWRWR
ncbi:hypothetical protein B0H12DRAFT_1246994 [Mycena haematopus]|nr:hypothetical protein B0H12DRAFT_1246994 [Mycena haematopus]